MIQKTNKNELRKTETKGRILWAAFKLFLAHGYHAVSFMSIEQVSQVTRGAIFYHFRNKEDLLRGVAEKFVIDFLQSSPSADEVIDDQTPLKSFLDAQIRQIEQRVQLFLEQVGPDSDITSADFMSFLLFINKYVAGIKRKLQAYEEAQAQCWLEAIHQGQERGEIRKEVDTETLYNAFHSVYVGIAFHGAVIHQQFVLDQLRKEWDFLYQLATAH